MKTSTLLIGAGLAGGAVLLVRALARRQEQEQKSSGACEAARAAAELAQPGSGAAAYAACQAASWLKDKVITDWNARDAKNRELNGAIEIPMTNALSARTFNEFLGGAPALRGSAVRFANGCVPFKGAPGWEKCAAGTFDMRIENGKNIRTRKLNDTSSSVPVDWPRAFSQLEGDPFTQGPYTRDSKMAITVGGMTSKVPEPKFPLDLGENEVGWFAGGRAFKCAAGKTPAFGTRDQRTGGGVPPCDASAVSSEPPPPIVAPIGSNGGTRTQLACNGTKAPAGYTWAGDHWERLRAGQSPNNGPCDPNSSSPTLRQQLSAGTLATAIKRVS